MSKRIYIDTNVYLDYLEDRVDNIRPLGEFAFNVFRRTLECKFEIVCSDWVLEELRTDNMLKEKLALLINDLKKANKFEIIKRQSSDKLTARNNAKNWTDYLHVMLALRANAEFIVTRNVKDFEEFQNLLQSKLPENI